MEINLEDRIGDSMRIKVMHYNILHGFHSDKHVLEEERLRVAQKAVAKENPDVLVLTEACYGENNPQKIKMNYGEIFRFPNYAYFKRGNSEWGSALLSKYPILNSYNNERGKHQHVRTKVDFHDTPIGIDIVHPHPELSEDEKKKYFEELVIPGHENPYILAGDFNALSDEDPYNRDKMIAALNGKVRKPVELVDSMLKRKVIPYIRAQGLIDTYKIINPTGFMYTIPTNYLSTNKDSGIRIDYVFCSPDFSVKDAYVVKNENTEKASDHYPVVAVLEYKKK